CRVRGELVPALVLELLPRAHETDVALLHQVEEPEAAVGVAFGDADDEAQVGLDEPLLSVLRPPLAGADEAERLAQLLAAHAHFGFDVADLLASPLELGDHPTRVVEVELERPRRIRGAAVG